MFRSNLTCWSTWRDTWYYPSITLSFWSSRRFSMPPYFIIFTIFCPFETYLIISVFSLNFYCCTRWILRQFNLIWLISLYYAPFGYFYPNQITPLHWLKPLNLSYLCRMVHILSYSLSVLAGLFPKIHPICVLNFQSLPVSLHRWLLHKCPLWFQY